MFAVEVREQCMLQLEWSKTELFSWDGVLPAGCPEGITLAGEDAQEGFRPGFLCYGVPVGTPEYATSQLWGRARKIVADAKKTVEILGGERQALWAALKWSISQRFDYWCQLSVPSGWTVSCGESLRQPWGRTSPRGRRAGAGSVFPQSQSVGGRIGALPDGLFDCQSDWEVGG